MNGKHEQGYDEPCYHCGMTVNKEDDPEIPRGGYPDPCLGVLPGVIHACCGHGYVKEAYVVIGNSPPGTMFCVADVIKSLKHDAALDFFYSIGRGPAVRPSCYDVIDW